MMDPAEYRAAHDVVVGVIKGKVLDSSYHACAMRARPWMADYMGLISSPRIASARNMIVKDFLMSGHEWLLMIDSDMVFDPEDIVEMVTTAAVDNYPILSGLYFGGQPGGVVTPHAYIVEQAGDEEQKMVAVTGCTEPGKWGGIIQVHGVGAGFLLMHREALERVGSHFADSAFPWFMESDVSAEMGEDITFCFRASSLGIPIHCHTGVQLGHLKTAVLDGDDYADYLMRAEVYGDEQITDRYLSRLRILGARVTEWVGG